MKEALFTTEMHGKSKVCSPLEASDFSSSVFLTAITVPFPRRKENNFVWLFCKTYPDVSNKKKYH